MSTNKSDGKQHETYVHLG